MGPERLRFTPVVLSLGLALTACAERSGAPAPVVDRTGIYYTKPAPDLPPVVPAPSATVQRAAPATTPTARRAKVTAEPLAPPPAVRSTSNKPAAQPKTPPRATAALDPGFPPKRSLIENKGGVAKVQRGETLYAISRRERIPIRALIEANRLKPPYALRAGQPLKLPPIKVYIVAPGDTVSAVARRFDAGISDVIRENDLKAPDFGLFTGQRLVLPWQGGKGGNATATAGRPAPESVSVASRVPVAALPRAEIRDPGAPPPKRAGRKFLWPVRGKVVSGFGSKGGGLYNDGINISARNGDFVRAAENGIVAYSGNELRGYGNLLLVRHSDGWVSAYAHNGELLVRRGQVVKRGQPIAKVGASGAVAKPQLHFELRRGRKAVDPRPYMS